MTMHGYIRAIKKSGQDGPFIEIDKPEITIGRSQECDIRVHLPKVSRLHASINVEGDKVWLFNASKNPIKVKTSGKTILLLRSKRHALSDMDEFVIYERLFRYEGSYFLCFLGEYIIN